MSSPLIERRLQILALLKEGKRGVDICNQLNVTGAYVTKVRQLYGLPKGKGGRNKSPHKKMRLPNGRMDYKSKYPVMSLGDYGGAF